MKDRPRILAAGDRAVLLEFGSEITPEINRRIHSFSRKIKEDQIPGVGETVPSYCSLLIFYDPFFLSFGQISSWLERLTDQDAPVVESYGDVKEIPVHYGGESGPDLAFVAKHNNLDIEEVIRLHAQETYLVYVVGFVPGFAAMGTVPKRIQTPRLPSPRTKVAAGSVGIGGLQTGIYAIESPGGWQLIGRTPLELFDLRRRPPSFFQAGDYARFFPIQEKEFMEISRSQRFHAKS
jgi:inhibitor of KinA